LMARLPLPGVLVRAGAVLPFTLTFATITFLSGDQPRAAALVIKTYISALFVLILMGTTPLPELLDGLRRLKAPVLLLEVVNLLWRYLFVIGEQARYMRLAALARGGSFSFRRAAGAVSVLFARSIQRAEQIHRSMEARGHDRRFPVLRNPRLRTVDLLFAAGCACLACVVRLGIS
jgi:cobalt/nickel transport system permease protein